jgi:hypothetical protein
MSNHRTLVRGIATDDIGEIGLNDQQGVFDAIDIVATILGRPAGWTIATTIDIRFRGRLEFVVGAA